MRNCMKNYSTKITARAALQIALGLILSVMVIAPASNWWQASARSLNTQGQGDEVRSKPQPGLDQTTIQNVEATQAALVTEFDVNGLKVIVKRRPGSLTV